MGLNPTKQLLNKFSNLYKEKVGEKYPPSWGRDLKIFKDLLEDYRLNKLEKALDFYFNEEKKIYSIPFFKSELGNLLQKLPKPGKQFINRDMDRFND